MEKLNICLLNDSFPPIVDGVANVVLNYAKCFTEQEYSVVIATPDHPDAQDDYDFDVLRYPSINTIDKIGYVTGIPFDIKYISQFVDKDIDILHTHCPMTSNYLARILRDTLHKPIVFTYHTKYDIDIARAIKGKLIQEAAIKAIIENISACDEVWAVSKGAADNLKSLGYTGDIIIMENGIDMPKGISSQEDIDSIRTEYNLDKTVPTFLFVGRMMWYKGIRIILDALKLYKDDGTPFKMLFIGSGVEFEDIKEYSTGLGLEEHVIFCGMITDRAKLKTIFSACNLFLFPSTFDTNGLVVREAASSALPSVLIEGSAAAEGTIDQVNCYHIQENAQSLYKILKSTSIEECKRIGLNAMDDLYYSWEDASKKAYERYMEIVKNYEYKPSTNIPDHLLNTLSDASVLFNESKNNIEDMHDLVVQIKESVNEITTEVKTDIKDEIKTIKEQAIENIQAITKDVENRINQK